MKISWEARYNAGPDNKSLDRSGVRLFSIREARMLDSLFTARSTQTLGISLLMAKKQLPLVIVSGLLLTAAVVTAVAFPAASLGFWWTIFFWLFFWFIYYLLPAALLSTPFWIFGRHRARWIWWEFAILIVPYVVWVTCLFINQRGKGLQNVLEMFWLACTVPLAAMLRVLIGSRVNRKILAS